MLVNFDFCICKTLYFDTLRTSDNGMFLKNNLTAMQ